MHLLRRRHFEGRDSRYYEKLILLTLIAAMTCFGMVALLPAILMGAETDFSAESFDQMELAYTEGDQGEASQSPYFLEIPQPGISVPLYLCDVYEDPDNVQSIVDREESAALFTFRGDQESILMIADHDGQAFAALPKIREGYVCTISQQADPEYAAAQSKDSSTDNSVRETDLSTVGSDFSSPQEYTCVYSGTGINTGSAILPDQSLDITALPNASLLMYTCFGDWEHVWITAWEQSPALTPMI